MAKKTHLKVRMVTESNPDIKLLLCKNQLKGKSKR